ncbi:MAG: TetR/AcrR family transcriptional regulator [Deltaproteobacteria bacterium]
MAESGQKNAGTAGGASPRQRTARGTAARNAPPPAGPRGERTRDKIREAANELFLEHGFEATTVDAIVTRAGVSKGTFYLYFPRKEDLLLEYGTRRLRKIREMLPDLLQAATFREVIETILTSAVRGKSWDREVTGRALIEMGVHAERLPVETPELLFVPMIELGQARGEIRDDIPARALSNFVMRSILGSLRDWGLGNDDLGREEALDYAITLVFDAITKR